jgi:hypothetical protein
VAPHHKWMETSIGFDTSGCPQEHGGSRPSFTGHSLTIANVKLYHVLIGGGAALNLISLAAFQKL